MLLVNIPWHRAAEPLPTSMKWNRKPCIFLLVQVKDGLEKSAVHCDRVF